MRTLCKTLATLFVMMATPARAANDMLTSIAGFLLQTAVHESGHAALATAYGFDVVSYRPYPTMCGQSFAGGCVQYTISDKVLAERDPKRLRGQQRVVSMAGAGFSTLSVLALAPLTPGIESPWVRDTLEGMLDWQGRDLIMYTIIDSVTKFQGDWFQVAQSLNIPTWYLIGPGLLNFLFLREYRDYFKTASTDDGNKPRKRKRQKRAELPILPQLWVAKGSVGLSIQAVLD